ncbi:hypothetical protein PIB30_026968 [Stylosanthes scabra]|uniref:Uncharacterized protein n=1 Tax=Stylosanthes scabra TaxID=79078 RepID=A0ABU6QB64_9FABA|nr:hypothetical protein [Stylosanthes scabra]
MIILVVKLGNQNSKEKTKIKLITPVASQYNAEIACVLTSFNAVSRECEVRAYAAVLLQFFLFPVSPDLDHSYKNWTGPDRTGWLGAIPKNWNRTRTIHKLESSATC